MPARRLVLHALLGPALAGLPGALAWAPGLPPVPDPAPGTRVSVDASTPGDPGSTRRVALASGAGHVVASVGASDGRRSVLVEMGVGKPGRFIRRFPRGATNPTVGTDAAGNVVVLVRACERRTPLGKGADCGIDVVGLRTGIARRLPGGRGADIAAMDRGAVAIATGDRITYVAAPAARNPKAAPSRTVLPRLPGARGGTTPSGVEGLDLSGGTIAAVFSLDAAFGGSQLARFDLGRAWTTLGVSTDGGAAIGRRAFYAPTITPTGIRAFFDGAEDMPGYAARWTGPKTPGRALPEPATEVRAAKLGNPLFLQSAAFLGDRLLAFTDEEACDLASCKIGSYGPFPVG